MQVPEREHFVVSEVCSLFRCDEATLRRWRRRGIGPKPIKLESGTVLYPRSEVERYLAELDRATL
jgi:predicted DNA-binding transcriptional regulator AlpA